MGGSKDPPIQNGAAAAPPPAQGGGLPRSISMCNIAKTTKIRHTCQADIRPGEPPFYLRYFLSMTTHMIILPPLAVMVKMIREKLQKVLFDEYIWTTLTRAKVMNWCPTTKPLYPKWTRGDGNCLLHAVSLYLWGIHDDSLFLRGLVHRALQEDHARQNLRQRWMREKLYWNSTIPEGGLQLDTDEWEREWTLVVDLARDERQDESPNTLPYHSLEEIHIFVLANTIRRPVIVLSEHVIRNIQGTSLAPNHVGGVYLPTLCHSDDCVKSPVVLCYESNHFVPLLSMEDAPSSSPLAERAVHAVPLVTENLEILPVHFLSESEESQVTELFKKYLDLVELPWTKSDSVSEVLTARIHLNRLPDEMNLTDDYYKHIEKICREETRNMERNRELGVYDNRVKLPPTETTTEELVPIERNIATNNYKTKEEDQTFDYYVNNMGDLLGAKNANKSNVASKSSSREKQLGSEDDVPLSAEVQQWREQGSKRCIIDGCDYYGLPESGGRCSKCVIEYTKQCQLAAKVPSAPVKRTASFQGINRSLSDDVTTGIADISPIEDKKCIYPSCYLRSSRTTSPYCIKHKDKGTIVSRLNNDKERDVSSYYARQTLDTSAGESRCESNSLESIATQFPKMCVVARCMMRSEAKYGTMCPFHFRKLGGTKEDPNSLPFDSRREHRVQMERQQRPERAPGYADRMCKNRRCPRMGDAGYQGYCEDCHCNLDITQNLENEQKLKLMKGSDHSQRSVAERPKSWAVPKTSYGEKLLENQDQESAPVGRKLAEKDVNLNEVEVKQRSAKRNFDDSKLKVSNLNTTAGSVSPKRTSKRSPQPHDWREPLNRDIDPEPEPIRKCSKPGCLGIQALNNGGLCWPCVKQSLKISPPKPIPFSSTPPVVLANSPTTKPLSLSPLAESKPMHIPASTHVPSYEPIRRPPYSKPSASVAEWVESINQATIGMNQATTGIHLATTGSEGSPPSSGERLSYTQEMRHQPRCINPSCDNIGLEINKGLCQDCFNFLATKDTARHRTAPVPQIQDTTSELNNCIRENCDMFGTPEKDGYCSQCYIKYRTKQHPVTDKTGLPSLRSPTSLVTGETGLPSLRSPTSLGYYNTSASSITALPCSNHHCTRYGDPAFSGFCSACYADYGYNYDLRPERSYGHTASDGLRTTTSSTSRSHYSDPSNYEIRKCRNRRYTGCNNLSHFNCKGFCRGCYVTIRSNIH